MGIFSIMPHRNQKEYNRKRRERYKNDPVYRQKILDRSKKAEKLEKVQVYRKKYAQTEGRKRMNRIRAWRSMGVKHDIEYLKHYHDNVYTQIDKCESCNNNFEKSKKVLDHCHISGCIRNTICNKCNCVRGSMDTKKYILLLELHRHFK